MAFAWHGHSYYHLLTLLSYIIINIFKFCEKTKIFLITVQERFIRKNQNFTE